MSQALIPPNLAAPPEIGRLQSRAFIVGGAGLLLTLLGALLYPAQFFHSWLISFMLVTGLALGSLGLVMLQYLSGGAWGLVIRRVLESATRTLPLIALLFLPLLLGLPRLYAWARPAEVASETVLQHKQPYLNVPFFLIRAALYFAVWLALAYFLNKWSREQDREPITPIQPNRARLPLARRFQLLSSGGLVIYVLTMTFAAIDWVMSLEPAWFSTMFGLILIGGQALSALAFVVAVLVLLARFEPFAQALTPNHLHDLGKLMLTFVMLWAYFSFSQFLIIWSGNLPEETPWYVRRLHGGWQYIGLAIVLLHFALPFLLLLSRDLKRHGRRLVLVALLVLAMRFVDLFWLIAPSLHTQRLGVHWLDVAALIGNGGLWLGVFAWQLQQRPLLPVRDPDFRLSGGEAPAHESH
jgi:hypothetical protein